MAPPKIAIFMPAYEPKRSHIRAAVESVLAQTFSEWTLLINDDASKREDTQSHIADFLSDPRITFRRNLQNLGIGGNWNACWMGSSPLSGEKEGQEETMKQTREALGLAGPSAGAHPLREGWVRGRDTVGGHPTQEYVAFLFHDDLWEPRYLETMLAALDQNPSAGFAAANHTYVKEGDVTAAPFYDEVRRFIRENITPGLHDHRAFLRWWMERGFKPNVIGEPSFVVLRRSLMEEIGKFNESMVQFLDSEYWARCLLRADWVHVPEDLGKFRVHPAGMSAVNEGLGRGVFERFQTMRTIVAGLPHEERRFGHTALANALSGMIDQYFTRKKEGKSVNGAGSGGVKKFLMMHPILTMRAGIGWLMRRR